MFEEQRSLSGLPFKGASKTGKEFCWFFFFYRGNSSWGQGVLGEGVGKGGCARGEQRAGACWGEVCLGEGWCWLLLGRAVLCKHQPERGSGAAVVFSGRKHGWEKGEGVLESTVGSVSLHGAPSPWNAAPIPHGKSGICSLWRRQLQVQLSPLRTQGSSSTTSLPGNYGRVIYVGLHE